MFKQATTTLAIVLTLVGLLGCERMDNPQPRDRTEFARIPLTDFEFPGAIPTEYGRLVSVTSSDTYPGWAQLWFERSDSSIVTMFINFKEGTVSPKVLEIPRS